MCVCVHICVCPYKILKIKISEVSLRARIAILNVRMFLHENTLPVKSYSAVDCFKKKKKKKKRKKILCRLSLLSWSGASTLYEPEASLVPHEQKNLTNNVSTFNRNLELFICSAASTWF